MFEKFFIPTIAVLCIATFNIAHAAQSVVFYHTDTAGSPIAATDSGGNKIWRQEYSSYGQVERTSNNIKHNDAWFTGKPLDRETGLNYMNARYYDSEIGRFITTDAVSYNDSGSDFFNRYRYANNNPYKYVDPDGNEPYEITFSFEGYLVSGGNYKVSLGFDDQSLALWTKATVGAGVGLGGRSGLDSSRSLGEVREVKSNTTGHFKIGYSADLVASSFDGTWVNQRYDNGAWKSLGNNHTHEPNFVIGKTGLRFKPGFMLNTNFSGGFEREFSFLRESADFVNSVPGQLEDSYYQESANSFGGMFGWSSWVNGIRWY